MTTGTPTPATPAPTPQKKQSPLVRVGIGCAGLLVLGCIGIGGFAMYENNQQEQNYNAGHTAFMAADCATAVGPLGKAASGEPGTKDSDVARKAEAELQECQALLAADEQASTNKAAAVLGYSNVVLKYPDGPLKDPALTKGSELVTTSDPAELATVELCNNLDLLTQQQLIANPAETMPPMLFACGQAYENEQMFTEALIAYDRFREEYPSHSLAAEVQTAFVRATIADAEASGAGTLPAPQTIGSTGSGPVKVIIQNDSPERLTLIFNGPEVRVEELEACTDCVKFTGAGPAGCPEKGPIGEYILAPGNYDVVVKAVGGSINPFRGSWSLESGGEYSSCFYLVTRAP